MSEMPIVDTAAAPKRPWPRRLLRWTVWMVLALALIVATVIIGARG